MATITVTELASTLDASPREVRKFLRSVETLDAPGKGGRWAIEKREVRSLTKKFTAWQAEKAIAIDAPDDAAEGDDDGATLDAEVATD